MQDGDFNNVYDFTEHYVRRELKLANAAGNTLEAHSLGLLLSEYMHGRIDVQIDAGIILWHMIDVEEATPSVDNH